MSIRSAKRANLFHLTEENVAELSTNQMAAYRPTVAKALDRLFNPRTIAVVGASRTKGKLGQAVLTLLKSNGYHGKIIPVNPTGGNIEGLPVVRSLAEIDGPIDVAVLAAPVGAALDALEICTRLDVKVAVGVTSGFSEAGDDGHANEERLRRILHDARFRLLGPNCEGVVRPASDLQLTFSPMFNDLRSGPVAIISQSGALAGLMALRLSERGVGINAIVSSGNETDLTAADLLDYLGSDPQTRVVLCYVEELREGRRFAKVAQRLTEAGKHVVVVKGGRSRGSASV